MSKSFANHLFVGLFPIIQSWLDDPDEDTGPVIDSLDDIENDVNGLLSELTHGDDDNGGGCTHSLFSLFSCIAIAATGISGAIAELTFPASVAVITSITSELAALEALASQIGQVAEQEGDDDGDDNDDQSQSESVSSSTSQSCSEEVKEHTYVTCSPTPVTIDGTLTRTATCKTGTSMVVCHP